jgi:hypothetical protein
MKVARFIKPLTVAFDPMVFEEIKRITDAEQISMGAWVRDAVYAALEKYQPQGNTIDDQ